MPRELFPADDRIAYCACGWGAGERKTVSQVRGHRSHGRHPLCAEDIVIVDGDPNGPAHVDPEDEGEETDEVLAAAGPPPPQSSNGKATVDATPRPTKTAGSGPSRLHYGEFTPVSTQRFTAPALLHAYFDWFCKGDPAAPGSAYEGDFQTWLCTLALDCLKEHWGLDFAVTIQPRVVATGGNGNGRHAT